MTLIYELAIATGLGEAELQRLIATAPRRYKVYEIPKRHGGTRVIAQPSRELKALQYYIIENKLSAFPVHRSAFAYSIGKNISDNANVHRRNDVILKLDFRDFFPSLTVRDWRALLLRTNFISLEAGDRNAYERILFWGRGGNSPQCLSIGAPSSPLLSNIFMHELDQAIYSAAREKDIRYTRYADDITVSGRTRRLVLEFEAVLRRIILRTKSPKLIFNDEKRGLFVRGQKQMVTGIVITPQHQISIGRERKRLISACIHHIVMGNSDPTHIGYTRGLLAFATSIEPAFVARMRAKYGSDIVQRIISSG